MTEQLSGTYPVLRDSATAYDDFLATSHIKPNCILNLGPVFDLEAHKLLVENTDSMPKIIENDLE